MELFHNNFVYFSWVDDLEGKKGFVSDSITELRSHVNRCDEDFFDYLHNSSNEHLPFFQGNNNHESWVFAYYDPLYEVKREFYNGGIIEFKCHDNTWVDFSISHVGEDYKFDYDIEYRIKPDKIFVPFASIDELIQFWEIKVPSSKNRDAGLCYPIIWVKSKNDNSIFQITGFKFDQEITINGVNFSLKELFGEFTFLDGSIIGKE